MVRRATAVAVGALALVAVIGVPVAAGPSAGAFPGAADPVAVGPMRPAPVGPGVRADGSRAVTLSTNWSGYAATAPARFDSVQGDYVQPAIVCTGQPQRYVAVWVGLDGFKDKTVEQDGTFATCTGHGNMTPTYVAWYEMYPSATVTLFTVNPGDEIEPAVSVAGGSFTLSVTDSTTGQTGSTSAACRSCRRASAEWIIERPELCTKKGCFLSALPDFTTATLTAATAGTGGGAPAPISSLANVPIDMIQPEGSSVELLDETSPLDATGAIFSSVWERSGKPLPLN